MLLCNEGTGSDLMAGYDEWRSETVDEFLKDTSIK